MTDDSRAGAAAQRAADYAIHRAHHESVLRRLADRAGIWAYCPNAACRRRRACSRDDAFCFRAAVNALMTDEDRAFYGAAFALMGRGVPRDQAFAQARDVLAAQERALRGIGM
ncbi:MAG: hypothetical protein DCF30_11755 [Hyphomicrobiales bacterium]|nr:MAG: hypothetical protein DCF30_11755 [Hyphomicrobiales bacterium]